MLVSFSVKIFSLKNMKTIEKIYVSIYNIKSKELSFFTKEKGGNSNGNKR